MFWFPGALTPGRLISADPLNETPPISLAVVNVAAEPNVFWFPVKLTPGKSILDDPLNETPPIFLAVSKTVAEAALPVVFWFPTELTPGRLILAVPSNDTPPIVLAVAKAVAVAALPVTSPVRSPVKVPENVVADKVLLFELNVKLLLLFGFKFPVESVLKIKKQLVSVLSLFIVLPPELDQLNTPLPFVVKTWPPVPSLAGKVNS